MVGVKGQQKKRFRIRENLPNEKKEPRKNVTNYKDKGKGIDNSRAIDLENKAESV